MMIIVFDKENEKWEWFNEQVSSNVIMKWEFPNDDEDGEDTLFLTAKTHQFVLQEIYGPYNESNKKTSEEALAWLANHDFKIPPDMLKKYLTEDNKI